MLHLSRSSVPLVFPPDHGGKPDHLRILGTEQSGLPSLIRGAVSQALAPHRLSCGPQWIADVREADRHVIGSQAVTRQWARIAVESLQKRESNCNELVCRLLTSASSRPHFACPQIDLGFVKILQLCMSVVSTCQVLFMITRAPRVPWEAIYLPGTEAITYGLDCPLPCITLNITV